MKRIGKFLDLIKFEHTLFALPFAYLGMMLAQKRWPGAVVFIWVTLAMVGARTAGMTLNRIFDLSIDQKNPRTKNRPLVTREISVMAAWILTAGAFILFLYSAYRLNRLCLMLAPVAFIFLVGYHWVKRYHFLCHWVLGMVLAMAPIGGWIAVTGVWAWPPVFLSLAVLFWVAGFDILYSLQDTEFDLAQGLHSVPVRFGVLKAIKISEYCHWATVALLVVFGFAMSLGIVYWVGVMIVAALLKFEHSLVSEEDLSRIDTAFFTINGWIGILLLVFTFLDLF